MLSKSLEMSDFLLFERENLKQTDNMCAFEGIKADLIHFVIFTPNHDVLPKRA